MQSQFNRRIVITLAALLTLGICFDEAGAQQQRRSRRSRRATNPISRRASQPVIIPQTQTIEPQIISTADQQASEMENTPDVSGQVPASTRRTTRRRSGEPSAADDDADSMRRTVTELSTQVTKLTDKLSQMEQQQRTLVDMERLSRAEVRAEALRTQLRDVQDKEANLTARLEQIDYDLKPENIERSVSTFGSTRPEDARDARRRSLESEKTRVRSQLDLLATSRQRLENAVASADLEVDKLRRRIEESDEAQTKTDKTNTTENNADDTGETTPTTNTTPVNPPATTTTTPPR
jgi:chromosome segregation ATPase